MKTSLKHLIVINIRFIASVIIFFSWSNATSQDLPFPSQSDALNKLKSSKSLANELKREYGITSISELKIEADESGFINYYSREGGRYSSIIPKDECDIIFNIKTGKDMNGVSYEIPISIAYTRLIRGEEYAITNKWSYYRYEVGAPIIYGAKKVTSKLKTTVVYQALIKAAENGLSSSKAGFEIYLYDMENCIQIDTIYASNNEAEILSATEQRWKLTLIGDFGSFESKGTKLTKIDENVEHNVSITAKLIDGIWQPKFIKISKVSFGNSFKPYDGGELFYTYKEIGAKDIIKKRAVKALPRYSEEYLKIYAKKFEEVLSEFTDNEKEDLEKLSFFIENGDEEISKNIRDFYLELKRKLVTIENKDISLALTWEGSKKIKSAKLIFASRLERANAIPDKDLQKKYLAEGMSKKALKEGRFYEYFKHSWVLKFKDDRWFISGKINKDFEIPF